MYAARALLQDSPIEVCASNPFISISFRTLCTPWSFATEHPTRDASPERAQRVEGPLFHPSTTNPRLFIHFRTLCLQWRFATPFPSITSALFPIQRRGEGSVELLLAARHSPFHCPLASVLPLLPIAISFVFIQIQTAPFVTLLF